MRLAQAKHPREAFRSSFISDPYRYELAPMERDMVGMLLSGASRARVFGSEEGWRGFTRRFVYNTNAIEGSRMSREEVERILETRQWPDKWQSREGYEAFGVENAIRHIRDGKEDGFSIRLALDLHTAVFLKTETFAGRLRRNGEEVNVVDRESGRVFLIGTPSKQVWQELSKLEDWYAANRGQQNPVVLAAVVHNQFLTIHPFRDGNGRVARLLLVNLLVKEGIMPIDVEIESKAEYYNALMQYQQFGNFAPTVELLARLSGKQANGTQYLRVGEPQ